MLDLYITLVREGKRTIESVPEKYQTAVKEALGL